MFNTNSTVANQVASNTNSLFTTTLNMATNKPAFKNTAIAQNGRAANVMAPLAAKRPAPAMQMSLGSSNAGLKLEASMPQMGFAKPQAQSTSFFGSPAPQAPSFGSSMQQAMPRQFNTKANMQMFAAGPSSTPMRNTQPSFMNTLGHQANISKVSRGGNVVMQAVAAPDKISLQQKYDNADHLDPVVKYEGLKYTEELMTNAKLLSAAGKGILASDESNGTCGKRFEAIGVENTEQNRNDYRELLYTVKGLGQFVSGAIMYDETIRQKDSKGVPLTKVLADQGILSGIKVDTGISVIEGTKDETVTNGLDGLGERAAEYYSMGARFAKWRAVLKITPDGCPSDVAITETAHSLARYAQICQHAGLVPIVEPEILTDGTHDIKTCARISEKVFNAVMNELITQRIMLEGMLLKPNMITSGAQAEVQAGPEEVAFFTVRTLGRTIPPAVPGITFLSGGQSEEAACQNLSAINKLAEIKHPWNMTYSFGRALQSSVLTTWAGKKENVEKAQAILFERCEGASQAALGKYEGGKGSTQSDYVANYVY